MTITITPRDLSYAFIGGVIGAIGLLWLGAVIIGIGIGLTALKIAERKTVLAGMAARLMPEKPAPAPRAAGPRERKLRVVK